MIMRSLQLTGKNFPKNGDNMIINDYMSVEKIKELCGDKSHINDVHIQFIECGKRAGLLESCGEGFYAF